MAAKFIITSTDHFRFGFVNMHRDLLRPGEECLGGGMYEFDYINSRMLLYGKSYDYGRPKWSMLNELILPASLEGLTLDYEGVDVKNIIKTKYE